MRPKMNRVTQIITHLELFFHLLASILAAVSLYTKFEASIPHFTVDVSRVT